MKTVYIGNLSRSTTDQDLEKLFSRYGTVAWASVVRNKEGIASQGFAFVEMDSIEHASEAITRLNGILVRGKHLKVNTAKAKCH